MLNCHNIAIGFIAIVFIGVVNFWWSSKVALSNGLIKEALSLYFYL